MKERAQSDQLLSTSSRSGAGDVWTEENTRRLLQSASTVPEPDEAMLLRVERRLQIAAEGHSYAAQSARRALVLRGVVLAYLFCLIASVSFGFRARQALHQPPVAALHRINRSHRQWGTVLEVWIEQCVRRWDPALSRPSPRT